MNPTEAKLAAPSSPGLRASALMLAESNPIAFAGAALGLCWGGPGRPKARIMPADMGTYGIKVYDEIVSRDGVTLAEFWTAAGKAVDLLVAADDPGSEDVAAHLGNSETASTGGST